MLSCIPASTYSCPCCHCRWQLLDGGMTWGQSASTGNGKRFTLSHLTEEQVMDGSNHYSAHKSLSQLQAGSIIWPIFYHSWIEEQNQHNIQKNISKMLQKWGSDLTVWHWLHREDAPCYRCTHIQLLLALRIPSALRLRKFGVFFFRTSNAMLVWE